MLVSIRFVSLILAPTGFCSTNPSSAGLFLLFFRQIRVQRSILELNLSLYHDRPVLTCSGFLSATPPALSRHWSTLCRAPPTPPPLCPGPGRNEQAGGSSRSALEGLGPLLPLLLRKTRRPQDVGSSR